jgi:hypothetical protein
LLLLAGCVSAPAPAPRPTPPTLSLDFPVEVHARPAADSGWLALPDVDAGPGQRGPHQGWLYVQGTSQMAWRPEEGRVYRLALRPADVPGGLAAWAPSLARFPQVQALLVWDAGAIDAAELAALARVPQLRSLTLQGASSLDGARLAALAGARSLERLRITGAAGLTDADVAELSRLPGLRRLTLQGCPRVTGASLGALATSPLESLDLSWASGLTAAGAAHLAAWPQLRELRLRGLTHLRDEAWSFLARLQGLQQLDLSGCAGLDEETFVGLGGLLQLESLDLSGTPHETQPLSEGFWLEHVQGLEALRHLDLAYNELGEDGVQEALFAVARLPALESLDLSSWELTGADQATLQACPSLRWVLCSLWGESQEADQPLLELPQVTAYRPYTSIEPFTESVPNLGGWVALRRLDLRSSDETGDGSLQVLEGLPELEWLLLDGAQVTDDGLTELLACPRLSVLSLRRCDRLTRASAQVLVALTELEVLDLRDAPWVDDVVLEALAAIGGLRTVLLRGTHVTQAGVARLRQALPGCFVAAGVPADAGR